MVVVVVDLGIVGLMILYNVFGWIVGGLVFILVGLWLVVVMNLVSGGGFILIMNFVGVWVLL